MENSRLSYKERGESGGSPEGIPLIETSARGGLLVTLRQLRELRAPEELSDEEYSANWRKQEKGKLK